MGMQLPPPLETRRSMIEQAYPVLSAMSVPAEFVESILTLIHEGHIVFIKPDRFALTTTGMLIGQPDEMPHG